MDLITAIDLTLYIIKSSIHGRMKKRFFGLKRECWNGKTSEQKNSPMPTMR